MSDFIDVFTKLCLERGESPSAVCRAVGLSSSGYTNWKRTGRVPRMMTLYKLADYFGVDVSVFADTGSTVETSETKDAPRKYDDDLLRIMELMKSQGLTQQEFCDVLGVHQQSFTNWKNGASRSYRKYMPEIAELLGVSLEDLTGVSTKSIQSKVFVERLDLLRRQRNLSRKQVLEDCHLGKNQMIYWEVNNTIPTPSVLAVLANYFGVSADYLLGKTENPQPIERIFEMLPYVEGGKRPIVGRVSAGAGVIAEQDIIGWQAVEPQYQTEDYFWLRVAGDSMSPKIDEGDLVLVGRNTAIENGNVAVVIVDETEGYVKRIGIENNTLTLYSYNPYYPPMVFRCEEQNRVRFVGKVIELRRQL